MFDVSEVTISELQRYVGLSKPGISKYFKGLDAGVTKVNNRITGISPDAVATYLNNQTSYKFFRPSVTLIANLCGGCGKTTSFSSLTSALRRITSTKDEPIVLIDGDPQASFTHLVFGEKASDDESTLIDYIEGKASLDDILYKLNNNIYVVKSNLNSAYMDKALSRPADIKSAMKTFYLALFEHLGHKTKIFQDHTPQLSNLFASSVSALYQMPEEVICNILIPIRSDDFAIQGGKYILNEIAELKDTYSFSQDRVGVHCFFSALDRRISSSGEALKKAMSDEILSPFLCPVVIRYSSEVPKSIMNGSNIFTSGKKTNATDDYQDLLQYLFPKDE